MILVGVGVGVGIQVLENMGVDVVKIPAQVMEMLGENKTRETDTEDGNSQEINLKKIQTQAKEIIHDILSWFNFRS